MRNFNREFRLVRLEDEARFDGFEFDECKFFRCVIEARAVQRRLDLDKRIVFSDCTLRKCVQDRCLVGPVVLQKCLLDGLQSPDGGMRIDGALFDQVVIRGDVGVLRVVPDATGGTDADFDHALYQANRSRYAGVSWAIDVTDAISNGLALYGIPPELIRYDPQRQGVIRRKNVENSYQDAINVCQQTYFASCISNLQYFPTADNVCVSIPSLGDVKACHDALVELRRLGFAD